MAEKEITPEQKREKLREFSMEIVGSPSVSALYATAALHLPKEKGGLGLDYGDEGKNAIYNFKYIPGLANQSQAENPDKGLARIQANAALEAELKAQKEGVAQGTASYSAMNLFESAVGFYHSGINNVKVGDILKLTGIEKYENLTSADLNMDMKDFKEKNEEMYNQIVSGYLTSLVQIETGEAIINSGKVTRNTLESILNEKPEQDEKELQLAA